MVRVNLLPERKQTKGRGVPAADPGQYWVLMVLGVVVLEVVALLFVEKFKQDELAQVTSENQNAQLRINEIQKKMADHEQVKAKLKELRDREDAIRHLQAGRTGPTAVLMELSKVLTPGKEPTAPRERIEQQKAENPVAAVHPNWDTRRLWLTQYTELERAVSIKGNAREPEDVSEFFRRLAVSDFFTDVKLLPGSTATDNATKQTIVKFEISAKVRY